MPAREKQIVAMRSGGRCAFPGCPAALISSDSQPDNPVITGQVAHIVAKHRQGPRGNSPFTKADRNRAANLLYLCPEHHTLVDTELRIYSVQVLRQMKAAHESRASGLQSNEQPTSPLLSETLQSTMLPVRNLPATLFSAPCTCSASESVAKRIRYSAVPTTELLPFLLREHHVYAFHDLSEPDGPFADVVDSGAVEALPLSEFTGGAEGRRRCVALLNSALRRHLRDKNLGYDKDHGRLFFRCDAEGVARELSYTTKTGRTDSRSVVYQPKTRATGEAKPYWWHMAARLSFQLVAPEQWVLSIRPERHLTKDGSEPLPPDRIGKKVTRLKATMYNEQYLNEIVFWRSFLSGGSPDIILNFGSQSCIIGAELVEFQVAWPGVAHDKVKRMRHRADRDLFEYVRFKNAVGLDEDEEFPDE